MRFVYILSLLALALTACPADDTVDQVDAGGVCTCTPETAAQTSYSNTSSALTSTNVQGALDELAVREVTAADIAQHIEVIRSSVTNPGTASLTVAVSCPTPANDIPLGGSCGGIAGGSVRATDLLMGPTAAGFSCVYE